MFYARSGAEFVTKVRSYRTQPRKSEERLRDVFHHLRTFLVGLILKFLSGRQRRWIEERAAEYRYEQRTHSNE